MAILGMADKVEWKWAEDAFLSCFDQDGRPFIVISQDRKSLDIDWTILRRMARETLERPDDWPAYGEMALLVWLATNEGVRP